MSTNQLPAKPSRQGRILCGYLLACLVSAIALAIEFVVPNELSSLKSKWRARTPLGDVVFLTMFIAPVVLTATLLPAALVVWWSEKRAERRFVVYAVAGILMAIVGSVIFFGGGTNGLTLHRIISLSLFSGPAGFIAGATYWRVAGRRAGTTTP